MLKSLSDASAGNGVQMIDSPHQRRTRPPARPAVVTVTWPRLLQRPCAAVDRRSEDQEDNAQGRHDHDGAPRHERGDRHAQHENGEAEASQQSGRVGGGIRRCGEGKAGHGAGRKAGWQGHVAART